MLNRSLRYFAYVVLDLDQRRLLAARGKTSHEHESGLKYFAQGL
jgi:hypothetical protein